VGVERSLINQMNKGTSVTIVNLVLDWRQQKAPIARTDSSAHYTQLL